MPTTHFETCETTIENNYFFTSSKLESKNNIYFFIKVVGYIRIKKYIKQTDKQTDRHTDMPQDNNIRNGLQGKSVKVLSSGYFFSHYIDELICWVYT